MIFRLERCGMKFGHIGDLHIGKRVHDFSMLEDQKEILSQILLLAKENQVNGVILAGDIYDRAVPPIDSNLLVPCAAGIRYISKVQRPVLPPNLFDCPCRLGDSCSDIWCLYAGWNFGVRPCASVNISRVWGRHAPTRALRKLT